jgi:hypothetical protein
LMAPTNEMSDKIDQLGRRVDEHGNLIIALDSRVARHAARVDRHELLLVGDDQLGMTGMVSQLREISDKLDDIAVWRAQMVSYGQIISQAVKITVALLGMIGFGVWWPELVSFYRWMMGG